MKNQVKGLLIVLFICLVQLTAIGLPKLNHQAPDFTVVDSNGKAHQLSNYSGNVVVLEWTNPECPFVKKHYQSGNMQALQKEFTDRGVVWLSVVSSGKGKQGYMSNEEANVYLQKQKADPTALVRDPDGKLGKLYGARTTPHIFIINKRGQLVYTGAIDSIRSTLPDDIAKAKPYVKEVLTDLLAGRSVKLKKTQPYGCSVKYAS
jgi:peroxiredoxin